MNDIRARFEEIWPVPYGVHWNSDNGSYWAPSYEHGDLMLEWNARLETFTRCQESMAIYVSLIEEMVDALDHHLAEIPESVNKQITQNMTDRAKQLLELMK